MKDYETFFDFNIKTRYPFISFDITTENNTKLYAKVCGKFLKDIFPKRIDIIDAYKEITLFNVEKTSLFESEVVINFISNNNKREIGRIGAPPKQIGDIIKGKSITALRATSNNIELNFIQPNLISRILKSNLITSPTTFAVLDYKIPIGNLKISTFFFSKFSCSFQKEVREYNSRNDFSGIIVLCSTLWLLRKKLNAYTSG